MKQDPYLGPQYRSRERFGDYIAGWSDGRRMLPNIPAEKPIQSPKLNQIAADHGRRIETLRVAFADDYQPLIADLMDIDRQLGEAQRLINEQIAALNECEAIGVVPGRGHGEDQFTDEFIATRRQREFTARMVHHRGALTAAYNRQVELLAKRDSAQTRLDALDDQKNAQLRRLDALHARRRATYLRGVTRTHGDRIQLSDFGDVAPTWNGTVVTS